VSEAEREALIQAVTSAWRPLGLDECVRPSLSWYDLDAAGRLDAFEATVEMRQLEAAANPNGLSTTRVRYWRELPITRAPRALEFACSSLLVVPLLRSLPRRAASACRRRKSTLRRLRRRFCT
jgi:hypothetical protein